MNHISFSFLGYLFGVTHPVNVAISLYWRPWPLLLVAGDLHQLSFVA